MVRFGNILLWVDLIIGLYFINLGLNFIVIPESILSSFGSWINVIAGILIIIGGLTSMRRNPSGYRGRY